MKLTREQALKLEQKARQDPAWWMNKFLGADLWPMQVQIAESVRDNRYTSVVACHGPGKTFLAGQLAPWFLYTYRPSKVITTAPTARQVYSLLWSEIRTAHARAGRMHPLGGNNPLKTRIELAPDWFAEGFSTRDYDTDKVTGYHSPNILIIVDEASGVPDSIFNALEGLMASGNAHMLLIGNPNRAYGRFYDSQQPSNRLYSKFVISAYDTPNFLYFGITREDMLDGSWVEKVAGRDMPRPYLVTPEWVGERITDWGPESTEVRIKVDGKFPEGDESDLVIPPLYLANGEQQFFADDVEYGDIYIGVDVGRYGTDESVIAVRAGRQPLFEKLVHQQNTMAVVGAVLEVIDRLEVARIKELRVDVIGIGAGPVDRLRELQTAGEFPSHIDIIGVNVAQAAAVKRRRPRVADKEKLRFVSQRDWLWWQLRQMMQDEELSTKNMSAEALKELSMPTYERTSHGQIKVESKDDLRKVERLGRSPDRADAWMLAFCDVVPEFIGRRAKVRARSAMRR